MPAIALLCFAFRNVFQLLLCFALLSIMRANFCFALLSVSCASFCFALLSVTCAIFCFALLSVTCASFFLLSSEPAKQDLSAPPWPKWMLWGQKRMQVHAKSLLLHLYRRVQHQPMRPTRHQPMRLTQHQLMRPTQHQPIRLHTFLETAAKFQPLLFNLS